MRCKIKRDFRFKSCFFFISDWIVSTNTLNVYDCAFSAFRFVAQPEVFPSKVPRKTPILPITVVRYLMYRMEKKNYDIRWVMRKI